MKKDDQENSSSEEEIEFVSPEGEATEPAQAASSDEVSALKEQVEKAKNDYLYLMADFENYKKNMIKERSDYMKYGSERLIVELLDVLDNFDRALETKIEADNNDSVESFKKGMELTASEFRTILKKFGVEELPCKGEPFDPNFHEALGSEETDAVQPGYITNVFKNAYKLHDRIVRPAQVIVAKEKSS
jgi:molecular chaperone GrpE